MKFSKRTNWNTEESELSLAFRQRQSAGLPIYDLTASNPTRCGFKYSADLLPPLVDPATLDYDPNPKGSLWARHAVCRYYADHGVTLDPGQVVLTTSTSEAYSYLFKLLCDPGDEVLVPQPSYPLFDFLADIEVVRIVSSPLVYDHGWQIDIEGLRRSITGQTRAIVLVHPNNPTGHFTKLNEARQVAAVCREFDLALIVDEVFLDYGFDAPDFHESFAGLDLGIPVFIVSGISKICALPQMKAAWLVAVGPHSVAALERLEVLADTYLSMNAPVQRALPTWLEGRMAMQSQILRRVQANLAELDRQLARQLQMLVNRLKVEGGWYTILRIPAMHPDEVTARQLLDLGVWVHPGQFFGMSGSGWLVISMLCTEVQFSRGIEIFLEYIHRNQDSYQIG